MITDWSIVFALSTGLAAAGFVVVAVLWLKKLRETLAQVLGETASQHLRTSQRLNESIAQLQRQQQACEKRIHTLTEANVRQRLDLNHLAERVAAHASDPDVAAPSSRPRVLH